MVNGIWSLALVFEAMEPTIFGKQLNCVASCFVVMVVCVEPSLFQTSRFDIKLVRDPGRCNIDVYGW